MQGDLRFKVIFGCELSSRPVGMQEPLLKTEKENTEGKKNSVKQRQYFKRLKNSVKPQHVKKSMERGPCIIPRVCVKDVTVALGDR